SLDYNVRVSDKSLYVTPTRGQLGNALKCVWAAPFVAHGNKASSIIIDVGGYRHTIRVSADQIQGCPRVQHVMENGQPVKSGSSVEVAWPGIASYKGEDYSCRFLPTVCHFAALNPHASFRYKTKNACQETSATDAAWKKWLPAERPSPHWYDLSRFHSLI